MFGDQKDIQKNLKDTNPTLRPPLSREGWERLSYTKTDKLITALYMVTDIVDKDEPLRNKLRTLGVEILSDITSPLLARTVLASDACGKIAELMSFLDIASAVNIISGMNCNILRKEFLELDQSIKESTGNAGIINRQIDLSEFFEREFSPLLNNSPHPNPLLGKERGNLNSPPERLTSFSRAGKGHTHIGVQKGSTLLKVIKDMSNKNSSAPYEAGGFRSGFDLLKKQRRDNIINIIKIAGGNATITDIKTKNNVQGSALNNVGEKTLQRELISMVRDHVLKKTGEKRWSRYSLK